MSCPFYEYRGGFWSSYYCMKKGEDVGSDVYEKYCKWTYEYTRCPIYSHGDSSGGCYLTTACVEYKGLPDDCRELTALRAFRDGYMVRTESGEKEIKDYYAIAPLIVKAISEREEAASVYEGIYSDVILPCVEFIESGKNEEAHSLYKKMVEELQAKYL